MLVNKFVAVVAFTLSFNVFARDNTASSFLTNKLQKKCPEYNFNSMTCLNTDLLFDNEFKVKDQYLKANNNAVIWKQISFSGNEQGQEMIVPSTSINDHITYEYFCNTDGVEVKTSTDDGLSGEYQVKLTEGGLTVGGSQVENHSYCDREGCFSDYNVSLTCSI